MTEPPPRVDFAHRPSGFDFCAAMRGVCEAMCSQLEELSHVDMARVAISLAQVRRAGPHGMLASLTPLRFAGGEETTVRGGRRLVVQRIVDAAGREQLYLLTFYLPRFQDQSFEEKLTTVAHELWHIAPEFNGDIRRHEGRYHAHTASKAAFDEHTRGLALRWLAAHPDEGALEFLRVSFSELRSRHGAVHGIRYRRPKLVPFVPDARGFSGRKPP